MYIFFIAKEDGGDGTVLPLNPDSLEVTMGAKNETYFLMNQGETVNPGEALCKTICFSSQLPPSSSPQKMISRWEGYLKEKVVLRLIVTGVEPWGFPHFGLNLSVILEKIKLKENGGEPGAVFFDLVFKEYRPFSLKVIST